MPEYINRVPQDYWGNPYRYSPISEDSRPLVYSFGFDGIDAHGLGDDVTSARKDYRCEDYDVFCGPTLPETVAVAGVSLFIVSIMAGAACGVWWAIRGMRRDPVC